MRNDRITVIGAGHGGKAMAAHLALMGAEVTLYNRTWRNIEVIDERGGISLTSEGKGPHGFGDLALSLQAWQRQSRQAN